MNKNYNIVLSFKEWNNWIDQGYLRVNLARIQPYVGSKQSFYQLMNSSADISHLDDNEYIIASLSKKYSKYLFQSEETLSNYISYEAVQDFYALTERGKTALQYSASNLQVTLKTDPRLEEFWEVYRLDQKNILEHEKALNFCSLFFENKFCKEHLSNIIENKATLNLFNPEIYLKLSVNDLDEEEDNQLKENFKKLNDYKLTKAFSGVFTRFIFNLEIKDKAIVKKYQEISKIDSCNANKHYNHILLKEMTVDQLTSSLLDDQILYEKLLTENLLFTINRNDLPLLALTIYFHYDMLIKAEYPINFKSLKYDIDRLNYFYNLSDDSEFKKIPLILIYKIGKILPSSIVNTIYYYQSKAHSAFLPTNIAELEKILPSSNEMNSSTHLAQHKEQIDRIWNNLLQKWKEAEKSQPTENINSAPLHDGFTTDNLTNVANMNSPDKENDYYKEDSHQQDLLDTSEYTDHLNPSRPSKSDSDITAVENSEDKFSLQNCINDEDQNSISKINIYTDFHDINNPIEDNQIKEKNNCNFDTEYPNFIEDLKSCLSADPSIKKISELESKLKNLRHSNKLNENQLKDILIHFGILDKNIKRVTINGIKSKLFNQK